MWWGWSPYDPRSSGIGFLLTYGSCLLWGWTLPSGASRHLPACGEDTCFAQLRDEVVDFRRRQVVVVPVLESHHRRELARAEALDLLVAEHAVGRDLARFRHPDRRLQVIDDLVRTPQHAAAVRADVEAGLADRLQAKERIAGRAPFTAARAQLERG